MSTELAVNETNQKPTLLQETKPSLILAESKEIANALADIIKEKKLYTPIQGKNYVHVEGWTTLGALLKVFPILDWSKRLDREDDEIIYESRVIAQTLQGEIIGVGEALASSKEKARGKPKWNDEYAIKSMSITRATSKAMRIPLGWIMTLAGYSGTPFEEMTEDMDKSNNNRKPAPAPGKPKPTNTKKPSKPSVPDDIDPNSIVDAEVKKKKPNEPEVHDMTNGDQINPKDLLGNNDELDKWLHTIEDVPTTKREVLEFCQELLGEQKLAPKEFRAVKKAMGMAVK